jgi:cell division protein FtsB
MTNDSIPIDKLQQKVLNLKEENFQLKKRITKLESENSQLKEKIRNLENKHILHQGGIIKPH